jgi:hypothetical protein
MNHPVAIDNLIHKRFMIDIMEQLLEAFNRYAHEDTITFTSEVYQERIFISDSDDMNTI